MILQNNQRLKENDFVNEKEMQNYFEKNIDKILGYKFISTEFTIGNFRVDTLAYDSETNSFRIIEYKNTRNYSLVDQGYTYLKLLMERKADFVLEYNLKTKNNISISDIDWSQSRIIFVSPSYTKYQLNATDFKNIPVDLYKITRYEKDIVEITYIAKTSDVKIEEVRNITEEDKIVEEIKVYTEEDHLSNIPESIRNLYEVLKEKILELDDIDLEPKKMYISFKGQRNIVDVELRKSKIKVDINMKKGTLNDPFNITMDISNKGHWGNGDYKVEICKEDDIDLLIPLIKQSLKINKK